MRKTTASLLLLLMAVSFINPVFAATKGNVIQKTNIGVVINGKRVKFEKPPVVMNGRLLVPARAVMERLGASVSWNAKDASVDIFKGDKKVHMKIGDKSYEANGKTQSMDAEPILLYGSTMVPVRFVAESIGTEVGWNDAYSLVLLGPNQDVNAVSRSYDRSEFVVVIDAGHGGNQEPGAVYEGIAEKDLNLDIAKKLSKLLKSEGIKVYMTRENDSFLGLYSRSDMANTLKADLLVSIHNNASLSKNTAGSMSLYNPGTENFKGNLSAREFAEIVQQELTGVLKTKDLGVLQRPNLAVLRTAEMPAVLAEIGYMSNSSELSKLNNDQFRQNSAEALRNAVLKALAKI